MGGKIILKLIKEFKTYWCRLKLKRVTGADINLSGKSVLCWLSGGMTGLYDIELPIIIGLKARGYKTHIVVCDGTYIGCANREVTDQIPIQDWSTRCKTCYSGCVKSLNRMGLSYTPLGRLFETSELESIRSKSKDLLHNKIGELTYDGIDLSEPVRGSIIRYYQGEVVTGDQELRLEYIYSGIIAYEAARRMIKKYTCSTFFSSHGVYVDWGAPLLAALKQNLICTVWYSAHLLGHYFFVHPKLRNNKLSFGTNVSEKCLEKFSGKFDLNHERELLQYIYDRYNMSTSGDVVTIPDSTSIKYSHQLDFHNSNPVWCVFSHILWDQVAAYDSLVFESLEEWLLETIKKIISISNVNWIIKIHPHETSYHGFGTTLSLISNKFPSLPPHVKVIASDVQISTEFLMSNIDGAVTAFGTSGIEAAVIGKPVILASNAYYANSKYTFNPKNKYEYFSLLASATSIKLLSHSGVTAARIFAYLHFLRSQIRHPLINAYKDQAGRVSWSVEYDKVALLVSGADKNIDLICDGIITGKDFIFESLE
jgi:hypothetical protein